MTSTLHHAVFLDRDGVINHDSPGYITSIEAFIFIPRSLAAIARLTAVGRAVFVITNQSAVNRGFMTLTTLMELHRHMIRSVEAAGGRIREIFYCPHRPDEGCACRKPLPGMILAARDRHGIELASSVMIGDRGTDIGCGRNAGCGMAIRVGDIPFSPEDPSADHTAPDLFDAVTWLLSHHGP